MGFYKEAVIVALFSKSWDVETKKEHLLSNRGTGATASNDHSHFLEEHQHLSFLIFHIHFFETTILS